MNDCIDNLKSKLVSAIDLEQKKILRVNDVYDVVKKLENFPMTIDILNSSRIGKVVNDIRHFNEAASDFKGRLKDLIKRWNDNLFPVGKKRQSKSIETKANGGHKVKKVSETVKPPESKSTHGDLSKSYHSSKNNETLNGHKTLPNSDCDPSFETPIKRAKYENDIPRSKLILSDSSKFLQKENHFDKTISHSIAQANSHSSLDKTRKRKHESVSNGIVITPIQKVKSTMEILTDMGDLVGNDTKKKILCNEIILEDDTPRSFIPESVKSRVKPLKTSKSAQSIKAANKPLNISPKVPYFTDDTILHHHSPKIEKTETKEESQQLYKLSPYLNHRDTSPLNVDRKTHKSHKSTPVIGVDENKKVSLKLKLRHNSKSKDRPVTNRMNEIPVLVPLDDDMTFSFDEYIAKDDRGMTDMSEAVVDRLAHHPWVDYNITRHPTSGELVPFVDMYIVNGLYILPWTDKVYKSRLFFPDDTADELTRISDSVTDGYS